MGLLFNKGYAENAKNFPKHIGIIMDGNGRWAKRKGLPRVFGHKEGAKTFKNIVLHCKDIGVEYLTVYAFSTENWKRPADEVNALMKLFEQYMQEAISDFKNENIRVKFLGKMGEFSKKIKDLAEKIEFNSRNNDSMVLNIALNYGGRSEIVEAVKGILKNFSSGKISISDIDEKTFADYLYTAGQPDLDVVIRTGGEFRVSNFFIWQSAYAEYFIKDTMWPDFKNEDLDEILALYTKRDRRFGGV